MNITFTQRGSLMIEDARITYKNFSGVGSMYNREGDKNFALIIPDEETKDRLIEDVNEYGIGWNVKIKAPRDEQDDPFMYINVKVKFNDFGPTVYLISGNKKRRLDKESVSMLDKIRIASVDMEIAPSDGKAQNKPYRAAYLRSMYVIQEMDRFSDKYAEYEE